jgi:hypothetical protein
MAMLGKERKGYERSRGPSFGWRRLLGFVLLFMLGCTTHSGQGNGAPADADARRGMLVGTFTSQRVVGILGSLDGFGGHTLEIGSIADGEVFTVSGAGYFQLSLEPGEYELLRIRLDGKDLVPRSAPFRFVVKRGEVSYVGSIVTMRDVSSDESLGGKTYLLVPGRRNATQRKDRSPRRVLPEEVMLHVVNAQSAVEELFRRRNPDRAGTPVILRPAE